MGNPNASTIVLSSESSEQSESRAENLNPSELPPNQQVLTCPHGPVAILWDIENCPVPTDVRPEDVAGHIRMALQIHPTIKGAVTMFSAYGDFNAFPRRLREGCQRTGVKLIDVPNGRKDAADKAILVDMFLFALDNPPPSSIMLISGDVDFAPALHILGQRGYNVILVIPSGKGVSSALCNAGRFVWDWPSVACGEGFVPSGGDAPQYFMLPHMGDNQDGQNEGESILYRGISQNCHNSRDFSIACQALSEYNSSSTFPCLPPTSRSHSLPFDLDEVSSRPISSVDLNESTPCVQPGDLNGLKGQLVKLLEMSGGCLPIARVPSEYHRIFGRPLYVSVYGSRKLVNLFQKMSDSMAVEGKGQRKFVYLRNVRAGPSAPPLINAVGRRGKSNQEENVDIVTAGGSSDELSEDERAIREEIEESGGAEIEDQSLEQFKHELQEILVSYSCQIFIGCFEAVYEQRYKKPLNYGRFGVVGLEELFVKVRDVVVLHEEAVSKRKFPAAVGV